MDDESATIQQPFTLTKVQAERLAGLASPDVGWTAQSIDGLGSLPPDTLTLSELVAGWISSGSAAAGQASAWIGDISGQRVSDTRFPPAVLALFVADLTRVVRGKTGGSGVARTPHVVTHHVEDAAAGCSAANAFLTATAQALLEGLGVGKAGGQVPAEVAQDWRAAVALLTPEVRSRAGELTPEIFSSILTSAATLGLAVEVATYFQNVRLYVSADHLQYRFAIGAEEDLRGTLFVGVDPLTSTWPPALRTCAESAGVPLPALIEPGAQVNWLVRDNSPLMSLDQDASVLADDLTSKMGFVTGREDADAKNRPMIFGQALVEVLIPRQEIATFLSLAHDLVTSTRSALLASVKDAELSAALTAAYGRAIDPVLAQLELGLRDPAQSLFTLSARYWVWVNYHEPPTTTVPTTPPPTPEPPPPQPNPGDGKADAFCAKLAEPNPAMNSDDIVAIGSAGVARMTELQPLAPPELADDVAIALDAYRHAAAGDWNGLTQRASAVAQALLNMYDYCGLKPPA